MGCWNFTRDFFNSLYKAMSGIYQGIINRELARVKTKQSENPVSNRSWNER
jgi:hypothetical protein